MGAFTDLFHKIFDPILKARVDIAFSGCHTVAGVESVWDGLTATEKAIPAVAKAYASHKAEFEAQGLDTPADLILGYLGKQIADAIFAVTEHTLPNILSWMDDFQESYHIRNEELDALKQLAGSGEFGLNAVTHFMLGMTLAPAARTATAPYWEDLEHISWAAHPSRLPSMTDLVRMEYREIFRPEFRKELIEDEPISADFQTLAAQVGYSKAQAENYWGAHWDLPSRSQGYEMYHRLRPAMTISGYNLPATYSNPFELDDLNTLLKRSDVLYRYRDQLVEIAYKPFTRVDVRRMYRAGVLSFEEVIAAYLDAGYAPDKALKMAEFTKSWVTEGLEKRETKSGVLDAMKIGIISDTEAETELGAFYPADVAERYVDIAKVKNKLNQADVAWLLGHEDMDEGEARDRFAEMGYPPDDVDYLIIRYGPEVD